MAVKIIKWMLVVSCMISIFCFSADTADESTMKSNHVIVSIAELFVGHNLSLEEREEKIEEYVTLVRKGAHFLIYFVLGFLMISLLIEYKEMHWKLLFLAFLFSTLYAFSDEIHQLFVPGRSGSIIDVGIDSIGSYFGVLLYSFYYRLRRKHE
ncbi:MAG: VanZ family protein [Bacilli bacterium]|nr:VanZ family protein [Bacilli bacterium]